jgi:hypothetical protein
MDGLICSKHHFDKYIYTHYINYIYNLENE